MKMPYVRDCTPGGSLSHISATHPCAHTSKSAPKWRITHTIKFCRGGAGKAGFNVATPTYEARTRPLHVQHTYYLIIFKQNPFNIISRGVQR